MPSGIYIRKPTTEEWRRNISVALTGKKRTTESRKKQSESRTGKSYKPHSEETKRKIGLSNSIVQKGKKKPWKAGSNNHFWKGGVTLPNENIRKSVEYRLWREAVFKRDNWTCVWCKQIGGKLHADHIKRFADYLELRFAIDNGRTLCIKCHTTTETYGNRNKKLISLQ